MSTQPAHVTKKSLLLSLALALAFLISILRIAAEFLAALQCLLPHLEAAARMPLEGWFAIQCRAWVDGNHAVYSTALSLFLFALPSSWPLGLRASQADPEVPSDDDEPPSLSPPDRADCPAMEQALDPKILGKHLARLSIFQWIGALQDVAVKVMKHRGNEHCIFEVALRSGFVGKAYATDRPDVYQFMKDLKHAGFNQDAELSIPQPIAYLPELRLLLQERVEGTPAKDIFKFGDERKRADGAERCGRWLAQFHASAPAHGKVSDAEKIVQRSTRKCALLVGKGGPLATKAKHLFEGLREARLSLGQAPQCAGHGDFGTYQIIFGERRTVVLDYDLYDVADPARDVARFIISLERVAQGAGSVRALDAATEMFLKTYLGSGGHPQVVVHLPFYKAAGYLRAASWKVKTEQLAWRERAEAMLDQGLRALEAQK
ncbi:MAG: hypothetical protein DMG21_00470 [Acidobacteria bacterium]|nr:MAG: hypothetical protein DMG21_00470 [Acidobacteriota bacterium]